MKKKLILVPLLTVILIVALIVATGCTGDTGLRGPRGLKGIQGEQGEKGELGIEGAIGSQGEVGMRGVLGGTGQQGDTGPIGATGEQGEQGERGLRGYGSSGSTGAMGPQGETGATGDIGPTGAIGDPGVAGDPGTPGLQGDPGIQGSQGIQGEVGPQGQQGETGDTGATGEPGADGWLPPTLRDVSTYGNFQPAALVVAWQSHSYPDDTNDAGAFITASGSIEPMGVVSTELRMAYTWDFYPFNKVALLYGYDQAGAPTQLDDVKSYTDFEGDFDITYTLEIVQGSDTLVLDIVGGYVREGPTVYWKNDVAYYAPPPFWEAADGQGTENTWIIGLSIDGSSSTGKFSSATGEGLIHLVVQSNNYPTVLGSAKHVSAYEIYLRID